MKSLMMDLINPSSLSLFDTLLNATFIGKKILKKKIYEIINVKLIFKA